MQDTRLDCETVRNKILMGDISCTELVEMILKKINEGKHPNAFISVLGDQARRKSIASKA